MEILVSDWGPEGFQELPPCHNLFAVPLVHLFSMCFGSSPPPPSKMNFLKQFGFTIITSRLIGILSVASVTPGQAESAVIEHRIPSPYQAGDTSIRILLPDTMEEGKRYRALYVLPVRPEDDERHGQGLEEVRRLDNHNQFEVICITPAFSATPWYNNHATDPQRQDEKHFLETVLPFVEAEYPLRQDADGRLLLGFSKSGWGGNFVASEIPRNVWQSRGLGYRDSN